MKLSAVTICQDEEEVLGPCLVSVRDYVDEHVVIDGGSKDQTVKLAESMGAIVYHKDFTMPAHKKNFANQKNFGIVKATGDWVLIIDSDETIEEILLKRLRTLMDNMPHPRSGQPIDCFGFPRKNVYVGEEDTPDEKLFNFPDYQKRLFRNYCRFEGRIHEQLAQFLNYARTPLGAGFIIHKKTRERQAKQDNLYYAMRPTDYPDRLKNDEGMKKKIEEGFFTVKI